MSKIIDLPSATNSVLVNVIYNLVYPMLGSHDCVKCVTQADTDVYTTDVETFISALDFESASLELLIDALKSHKQQHKRGTKSLLYMITSLTKTVYLLEQWGIPTRESVEIIQKHMLELTKSVQVLARDLSLDKTSQRTMLNSCSSSHERKTPLPKEKTKDQCGSLLHKQESIGKQSLVIHKEEEKLFENQIFSVCQAKYKCEQDSENIRLENNSERDLWKKSVQNEDLDSQEVDWFFEDGQQEMKCLQLSDKNFPNINVESNKSLSSNIQSLHNSTESSVETCISNDSVDKLDFVDDLIPVLPDGRDATVSSCHMAQPVCQQSNIKPVSSDQSSHYDKPLCDASSPSLSSLLCTANILNDSSLKTFLGAKAVKDHKQLGYHRSLTSLNQMLSKLGKSRLKLNIASRHFQENSDLKHDMQLSESASPDSAHTNTYLTGEVQVVPETDPNVEENITPPLCLQLTENFVFSEHLLYLDSCHADIMDIVKQIYLNQTINENCFNPNLVDCLHVPVRLMRSKKTFLTATTASLYQGLLVACKTVDPALFNKREQKSTLLINADLTPSYHHLGFKPTLQRKTMVTTPTEGTAVYKEISWENKVLDMVRQLKVTLILVRGQASETLLTMCSEVGVAILTHVPYRTLSILATYHNVAMLTYIDQCCQSNVCSLNVAPMIDAMMDQHDTNSTQKQEIYFHISNVPMIQTVALSSSCTMSAQLVEERFWKCLHSVANAVSDGRLLPGAGETEEWCAETLRTVSDTLLTKSSLESVVVNSLADVFMDFSNQVKRNSLMTSGSSGISVCSHQSQNTNSFGSLLSYSKDTDTDRANGKIQNCIHLSQKESDIANCTTLVPHSKYELETHSSSGCTARQRQYDNYQAKLALWETAVEVVCMLVCVGSSVLTGVSHDLADF
ncbi:Bardet-Biedl syndrome 12 protein [Biomphalaria glabrata]|nr:Bardet-Biedl syndrome 12 protein-like protein [Biomphalaria glabrata]